MDTRSTPSRIPTPMEVAVLLSIREAPRHAYEVSRELDRRPEFGGPYPARSIYRAVEKLAEQSLIEPTWTGRVGRRPEKTTYRLTPQGRQALLRGIEDVFRNPPRETRAAGYALLAFVDRKVAGTLIRERIDTLNAQFSQVDQQARSIGHASQRVLYLGVECERAVLRAELTWLSGLLREIEAERMEWPAPGDGPQRAPHSQTP